jgi:hypothetical protein
LSLYSFSSLSLLVFFFFGSFSYFFENWLEKFREVILTQKLSIKIVNIV